jgi:hypothetical protein
MMYCYVFKEINRPNKQKLTRKGVVKKFLSERQHFAFILF